MGRRHSIVRLRNAAQYVYADSRVTVMIKYCQKLLVDHTRREPASLRVLYKAHYPLIEFLEEGKLDTAVRIAEAMCNLISWLEQNNRLEIGDSITLTDFGDQTVASIMSCHIVESKLSKRKAKKLFGTNTLYKIIPITGSEDKQVVVLGSLQ